MPATPRATFTDATRIATANGLTLRATDTGAGEVFEKFWAGFDKAFVLPNEKEDIAGVTLDGEVLIQRADESLTGIENHPIVGDFRYRAAGCDRWKPRRSTRPPPVRYRRGPALRRRPCPPSPPRSRRPARFRPQAW